MLYLVFGHCYINIDKKIDVHNRRVYVFGNFWDLYGLNVPWHCYPNNVYYMTLFLILRNGLAVVI